MYSLAICEIHNPDIHGGTIEKEPYLKGTLLLSLEFSKDEFFNNEHKQCLENMRENYNITLLNDYGNQYKHNIIRNYLNIIDNTKYYQLHIVEKLELETGETLAIIKTNTTISILQRKWKKYYKSLLDFAKKQSHPNNILYRKITGKWKK